MAAVELLLRLNRHLDYSANRYAEFDAAYSGDRQLGFLPPHVREDVGDRLRSLSPNFNRLVVDATEERLDVEGFRLAHDQNGSADLWSIWQANNLDELSQLVHLESLVHGRAYVSVWPGPDGPVIAPETARQVTVLSQPHNRQRLAALKRYLDLSERKAVAILFEPDKIRTYHSVNQIPVDEYLHRESGLHLDGPRPDFGYTSPTSWEMVDERPNPLGVVPVIPFENRPRLMTFGESELSDVIDVTDAIGKLWTDLMVTSEYSAAPRRYVTGLAIQEDEEGNPIPPFDARSGRLWQAEGEEVQFGQFAEADLSTYGSVIEQLVSHLGAITSLPPHYLNLGGEPSSADAIRSSEASLVAKCRRKQRSLGGSWERVMRLAVRARDGLLPPGYESLETMWANPETRTVAQSTDAALKRHSMGWPLEVLAEDLGYSPQNVERILNAKERERAISLPGTPVESMREIAQAGEAAK